MTVGNLGHFHPRAGPFHTPAFRGDVHPTPTPSVRFRSWDWVPDPRPCVCPPAVGTGPMVAQGPSQPGGAWQAVPKQMVWERGGAPSRAGEERAGLDAGLGINPTPRCARCLLRALGRASGLQPDGPRGHQPAACPGWGGRHAAEGPGGRVDSQPEHLASLPPPLLHCYLKPLFTDSCP